MVDEHTIEQEIAQVRAYWQDHQEEVAWAAQTVFMGYVEPAYLTEPDAPLDEGALLPLFAEWTLFEFPYFAGKTPFEHFVRHHVAGKPHLSPETQERLTAIADTQFFSRFEILGKDTKRLICTLRDVCDNARYAVYDPYLCSVERWNTGTIAERIARVDGMWRGIGRVHLYDRAPHEATDEDGPGMFHPEDRTRKPEGAYLGFYLRLVRDIAGREGRYRAGATYGVAQAML